MIVSSARYRFELIANGRGSELSDRRRTARITVPDTLGILPLIDERDNDDPEDLGLGKGGKGDTISGSVAKDATDDMLSLRWPAARSVRNFNF